MNIDDPKLTSYALGELSAPERAEIEKQLRDDPEARAYVEETAAFGVMLGNAFLAEQPPVGLAPEQRSEVIRQSTRKIVPFRVSHTSWQAGIGALAASVAIALLFTWSMGPLTSLKLADAAKTQAPVFNGIAASNSPTELLPSTPPLAAAAPLLPEDGSHSMAILDSKELRPAASQSQRKEVAQPVIGGNISMTDASRPKGSLEMPASNTNTYTGATVVTSGTLTVITAASPAMAPAAAEMFSMDRPIAMGKTAANPTSIEANTDSLKDAPPATPPALSASDTLVSSGQVIAMAPQPSLRGRATLAAPELPGTDVKLHYLSREKAKNIKDDTFVPTTVTPTSSVVFTSGSGDPIADVRSLIQAGQRPAAETIPVDALINAFRGRIGNEPLGTEVARCPWNDNHRLLCIRIKKTSPASRLNVDFGPDCVEAYRLIGGQLPNKNSQETAIRLGSGPSVTILYEIVPARIMATFSQHLATVRVTDPATQDAKPVEQIVLDRNGSVSTDSADFRLAAAVAEFGLLLSAAPEKGTASWSQLEQFVANIEGPNTESPKAELLELIRVAKLLDKPTK